MAGISLGRRSPACRRVESEPRGGADVPGHLNRGDPKTATSASPRSRFRWRLVVWIFTRGGPRVQSSKGDHNYRAVTHDLDRFYSKDPKQPVEAMGVRALRTPTVAGSGDSERISRTSLRRLRHSSCALARSAAVSLFVFLSQNICFSPSLLAVVIRDANPRLSSSRNRSSSH
jgi:hypothetical protein